jgi:putative endonuclease
MTPALKKQAAYGRGKHAEHQAAEYLRAEGYTILHERYKTAYGEIDLIAKRDNLIVFVEVKARESHNAALECLSNRQMQRILTAAEYFLSTLPHAEYDVRFDVITVSDADGVNHLENAFALS